MPEFDIIRRYFQERTSPAPFVHVGIGDDAAVLAMNNDDELVVAVDTLVAGVHFPHSTEAFDIGYKALAVNLSDLAAMGATPAWMTLALTLPQADERWLSEFAEGLFSLAREFNVTLVGGDTTQGPLTISVQVGGVVSKGKALLRSGAHVDDVILVTGALGDAAYGLRLMQQHRKDIPDVCLERLNRPHPRVMAGQKLLGLATSCIDISDGFYSDLMHITTASQVGAIIELENLPLSRALSVDNMSYTDKYHLALAGGDDYELCFTVAEGQMQVAQTVLRELEIPCAVVGRITADQGIRLQSLETGDIKLDTLGYQHFS